MLLCLEKLSYRQVSRQGRPNRDLGLGLGLGLGLRLRLGLGLCLGLQGSGFDRKPRVKPGMSEPGP